MRKIYFLALLGIILITCGSLQNNQFHKSDVMTTVSSTDEEMNAAIKKAQETLPLFIEALQAPKVSQTHFCIKAKFHYGDGNIEHIWVSDLSYSGDQFEGVISNEPVYIKDLHLFNHVTVEKQDISDWLIIENDILLGGFTIHVLRNRMTDEERKRFDSGLEYAIPDEPAIP